MVYVYFGPDYGLTLAKAKAECQDRAKKAGISEIITYDGFNQLVQEAVTDLNSVSLFNERKIVFLTNAYFLSGSQAAKGAVKEADQDYKGLISYLKAPEEASDFYLISTSTLDVKKNPIVEALKALPAGFTNCSEMTKEDYVALALKEAKDAGKDIDRPGAELLFERTSYTEGFKVHGNYLLSQNELQKLLTYTDHVRRDDVVLLVHKPLEDNVFDVVSSLVMGETSKALHTYQDLRKGGYDPLQLLPIMVSQLRMMALCKYGLEAKLGDQTIQDDLHISSGRLYYLKKETQRISFDSFLHIFADLASLEKGIKLSQDDGDTALALFINGFKAKYQGW